MAAVDPDAAGQRERRTCECGRMAPEGRWRCDDCQTAHAERTRRMLAVIAANRREASAERHGEGAAE